MSSRFSFTILCLLLMLHVQNSHAYAAVAWRLVDSVLKGVGGELGAIATQNLLGNSTNPQLVEIQNQLLQVQKQLNEAKQSGQYPSPEVFKQTQDFVNQAHTVLKQLQSSHQSLEDRIKLVEQEIPKLKQLASIEVRQAIDVEIPKQFNVTYAYRVANTGELLPLTQNAVLHSGDSYKIAFTPEKDSYVYILQVDSQKVLWRLFPIDKWGDVILNQTSHVRAGKTYLVPTEVKSFKLDQQTGTEKIYFIASQQPDPALEKLPNKSALAEAGMPLLLAGRGVAGIVDDPQKKVQALQMEQDGKVYHLTQQQLSGYCERKGCVNVLSFEHR